MMNGTVFSGPMSQGTVRAYAISGGMPGAELVSTTIGAQGTYSMSIGTYSGPVMLRFSGGVYTDEATGTTLTMVGRPDGGAADSPGRRDHVRDLDHAPEFHGTGARAQCPAA